MNVLITRPARIVMTSMVIMLAAACSREVNDIYSFIEQTKATNVGSVKPIPTFEPYKSFSYSANEMRDPFVADIDLKDKPDPSADALRPNQQRPKEPLETFPLDTLAMVGILEQEKNLWGLIKDPQNVVHRIQLGNYMGQNEGRVTEITDTDIRLIEIIPDGIGGYIERNAAIAIGNE